MSKYIEGFEYEGMKSGTSVTYGKFYLVRKNERRKPPNDHYFINDNGHVDAYLSANLSLVGGREPSSKGIDIVGKYVRCVESTIAMRRCKIKEDDWAQIQTNGCIHDSENSTWSLRRFDLTDIRDEPPVTESTLMQKQRQIAEEFAEANKAATDEMLKKLEALEQWVLK